MVAQALTWLNQRRWSDYAPAVETKARADPEPEPTAEQLARRQEMIAEGARILERMRNGSG